MQTDDEKESAWKKLKASLGSKEWTVSESATYRGFFMLGMESPQKTPIEKFEKAILIFGVKNALEYFGTPEHLHHLWSQEWIERVSDE